MALTHWPAQILQDYEVHEWRHATAILHTDFPTEFAEICQVLSGFRLPKSEVMTPGGRKSSIASRVDAAFTAMGWVEKKFDTEIVVDGNSVEVPTHKVDCYKNGVAFEIEWNNKTEFYDRDLNNFRLLFDLRVVSVGAIFTRASHMQAVFDALGRGASFGASTTHMDRLVPKVFGGGAGGCPVVVFGITDRLYDAHL